MWLGNARGNTYSRAHTTLSTSDSKFWDFRSDFPVGRFIINIFFNIHVSARTRRSSFNEYFRFDYFSWDEMGLYDLPAVITYITNYKSDTLIYIGHSMGTTMFYVMASKRPDVADKVRAMMSLAPVAYVSHVKSPVRIVAPFAHNLEVISSVRYYFSVNFSSDPVPAWRVKQLTFTDDSAFPRRRRVSAAERFSQVPVEIRLRDRHAGGGDMLQRGLRYLRLRQGSVQQGELPDCLLMYVLYLYLYLFLYLYLYLHLYLHLYLYLFLMIICNGHYYCLNGVLLNSLLLSQTLMPIILSHAPAGTSTKTLIHYAQEIVSGHFQAYDYGPSKNRRYYNSSSPPDYDLTKVRVPVAFFVADNDWLAASRVTHFFKNSYY